MRLIKLVVISLIILFIVIVGMSLLIPSDIRISRAIDIVVPEDSLLPAITDLQQWKQWNVLVNKPGVANRQFTSDSITAGNMKITKTALAGDTLFTLWQQQNGRLVKSAFTWQGNERLVLQWYFDIHLRWYPWEKFSSIIFDKQLGPSMEKSLDNLKNMVEEKP